MQKIIITFSLFVASFLSAQNFQGMAVYESKTSTSDMSSNFRGNREVTPEMQKMIEERMKAMFEKTFILTFDRSSSIYVEEEKIETPGQQSGFRFMSSMMGGGGTHYKNVKEKVFIVDKEFAGKEFLIQDPLPLLDWKLSGETKQIGNYTCFKATAVRPVSQSDFRNFRRKKEDVKKEENESDTKTEEKKEDRNTNFMDQWEMPKEIEVVAWYTPDIPISQGPENYWGLPGLIAEVQTEINRGMFKGSKIISLTDIKTSTNTKPIEKPKDKGAISQTEFDKLMQEQRSRFEEMRNSGVNKRD